MKALDQFLPEYEFSERHRVAIDAPAASIDRAVRELTVAEVPVARVLMRLRGMRRRPDRSFVDGLADLGVVLEQVEGEGMVVGLAGRFWRPDGGLVRPLKTPAQFLAYDRPDVAKAVAEFRVEPGCLSTETRVHVSDRASRTRFARYWRLVRPFSGLIRIAVLRAAKRRAENG